MDIVTFFLTLPVAPVRGVVAVANVLLREAERELYDPSRAQREIEEIEQAARSGQISESEKDRLVQQVLDRLVTVRPAG